MGIPISPVADSAPAQTGRRGRPRASDEKIASMKARIAQEARHLFLTEGYRAVSMRRIASGVGCTPMALYSYYPGKIDILRHIWAELFADLFADLGLIASQTMAPAQRLQAVSTHYVDYWIKHPDHYRMVFMSEGVSQPDVSLFVNDDSLSAHYQLFHTLLTAANPTLGDGAILRAQALVCALNGVAHSLITISGFAWSDAHQLVGIIVNGLIAPGETG